MKPNSIYGRFVQFKDSRNGKYRPVIVMGLDQTSVYFMKITTQFENKSQYFQLKYFKIENYQLAGLKKQSYIDTTKTFKMPIVAFQSVSQLFGHLVESDVQALINFLN
jgi:hypothetical protein